MTINDEHKKNPYRNVVIVGLLNTKNQILLVKTKRLPNHWQPIGGGIKHTDPTPRHAIQRELNEEINIVLELDAFDLVFVTQYDFGEGQVYCFKANILDNTTLSFNESELCAWAWYDFPKALKLNMFPATRNFLEILSGESFDI